MLLVYASVAPSRAAHAGDKAQTMVVKNKKLIGFMHSQKYVIHILICIIDVGASFRSTEVAFAAYVSIR